MTKKPEKKKEKQLTLGKISPIWDMRSTIGDIFF